MFILQQIDVNAEKGRQIDSLNHSAEEHRGKNPKKKQILKFSGPKEASALLPREKSVIALCVKLQKALAI